MPQGKPDFSFIFRRPFAEQVAFFRGKLGNLVPTQTWRDLMREQHDRAFMVAGAAKADLLADLAAAVDKAISDGESLDTFRKRFGEIVQKHGWQGWTGSESKAGTYWRTRVIYRTNMTTSYAAGRLAQLQHFPVWVYRHSGAEHPRLQHKAWDGLTLPANHEFWQTHYPPNGWGCGCRVAGASSPEDAARLGAKPGYTEPPPGWNERDAKGRLPGIDEGWDYMPGASTYDDMRAILAKKVATLPEPLAQAVRLTHERYPLLRPDAADIETLTRTGKEVLDALLDERLPHDRALVPAIEMRGKTLREAIEIGHGGWTEDYLRRRIFDIAAGIRPMGGKLAIEDKRGEARALADRVGTKLPEDWVKFADAKYGAVKVEVSDERGQFSWVYSAGRWQPFIRTDGSSTAEHEWMHLMQAAMPELDALFQKVHRRRTSTEALAYKLVKGAPEYYREDKYINWYFGREYFGNDARPQADDQGLALEVITMTYQALLGEDVFAKEMLRNLLIKDPQLLHLAIGALLRYKP